MKIPISCISYLNIISKQQAAAAVHIYYAGAYLGKITYLKTKMIIDYDFKNVMTNVLIPINTN